MAGNHDFTIDQGTTWNRVVTIDQNGAPVNLTGFTARMQLRRTRSQPDHDISLTTENGGLTINPTNGTITISMTADQTALLSDSYCYDLETTSGDTVARWLQGKVTISPEVTR
ncbi:BppU family phage baseplate upper protein [Spirosoma sp. KUDC1026]|uniref:BppU family phage baseplate upper protein n=1 Tax=Spirosoma sp. KUDC1026 TaxID=2745947 RepID=UPI00159BDB4F|nr:BppU family phage baseplate upper protein [Spirosoma sp. KUDC1026]QKZ15889.1 hypothetical protein HU175_24530 [Spirosoma sp. KUDC1026]